jgi:hypothetical protein
MVQPGGGTQAPPINIDDIVSLLREKLGDANIQNDGLETALIKDGEPIGKTRARVHFATGLTGAGGVVTIPHKLGRVPGYCRKIEVIPPAGGGVCHVVTSPKEYEKWTDSTLRVDILLVGPGSLDGAIVVLEVGGRRVA